MAASDDVTASHEPATELIGGLLADARDLATAHADRLRYEIRGDLDELGRGIKLAGVAHATVLLAGLLVSQAVAFAISDATRLPLWACFAIVGAVVAVAGYAIYRRRPLGRSIDLVPDQSIAAVKRDVERIADGVTS